MTTDETYEIDKYGDQTHPAFITIKANRVSTGPKGVALFDSDLRHQHFIRVTVESATRKRDLNRDWIHSSKTLFSVDMSEAQWASFVSSMNTSGVPATLTWDHGPVPEVPYDPRLAVSINETREAAREVFAEIKAARNAYEELIADKAPAKEIREARNTLHYAIENAESSVAFASKSLVEHAENVVQKARADIETFVVTKARELQLDAGDIDGLRLSLMPGSADQPVDAEIVEEG